VKTSNKTDVLEKRRQRDERPELYSLQESCRVLQNSYDDLYDDDDDDDDDSEISSVRSGISAVVTDSEDGTLSHSFSSESAAAVSDIKTSEETSSVDTGIGDDGPYDSAASLSSHPSTPSSDNAVNDVQDDDAMSDSDAASSDSDRDEPITSEDNDSDLYAPEAWESYYRHLEEIGHAVKNREGWPNFDGVFMISAIDGDGVYDVKVTDPLLAVLLLNILYWFDCFNVSRSRV